MGIFDSLKKGFNKIIEPWQKKEENKETGSFCSHCGTKLPSGAGFCSKCGKNVSTNLSQIQATVQETNKGFKCPNCGSVLTETTSTCSYCGIILKEEKSLNSVQQLSSQLLEIEKGRKKGWHGIGKRNPNNQILMLIKTFPIPSTIDEILELVLLAESNINVDLSKKKIFGNSSGEEADISNAWVSKMQLAYKKAEIMFPNKPIFIKIQKIYFDKMKELKIKV